MVNEGAEKLSGDSIQGHDRLLPVRIEPKARKTLSRSDRDCQGDGELGPPVTWASPSLSARSLTWLSCGTIGGPRSTCNLGPAGDGLRSVTKILSRSEERRVGDEGRARGW